MAVRHQPDTGRRSDVLRPGEAAVPSLVVYLPSVTVSDRLLTIVPYTLAGVLVFAVCVKALRLLSDSDKSYLGHLLPAGLRWVLRLF